MRRSLLPPPHGTLAIVLTCCLTTPAYAQTRPISLTDFANLTSVSNPEISPDGKTIAFVVSRPDTVKDHFNRELYLLDIGTGTARPLTHGREGVASPAWSPAGDRLAFLAPAGETGKETEQVFVLPITGGEAFQVTHAEHGVEQFAWRPDGKDIAYVTADDPPNKAAIARHHDAFEVGDNSYLARSAPTPSHLWLIAAAGSDSARRLTSGAWSLPKSHPPGPPASPISWSPDGQHLLFTRQADPHFGDADQSTIQVLDVATGAMRPLTDHKTFEGAGLYSPDGTHIVYKYPSKGDPNRGNEFYVTSAQGGAGTDVTVALDRNLARAIWMPDGRSFLVGAHDGTTVAYWIQSLSGQAKRLNLGDVVPAWSFWIDASVGKNGAIAFAGTEPGRPSELYYMASPNATPKRLTDFNHDIAALDLGRSEAFDWHADKFHEDGVLVYPPGFTKGKKYPLVLLIHGGPTAATTTGFSFLAQLFAANGAVVFQPNYRGSDNLGNAYQTAIVDDAGDGPGRDVMAGIAALEKRGFVDETRIGVSGWSYGGYMTTWLIGHYHIWKTAVAGAPVTNIVDQYNLADFNVLDRYGFLGSPWTSGQHMQRYREQSPITYAPKVTTPTLLLQDVGDARVTVTQGYEFYHALKDNGVPVTFYAYPTAGHFPSDPVRQMDVFGRWSGWLADHLK